MVSSVQFFNPLVLQAIFGYVDKRDMQAFCCVSQMVKPKSLEAVMALISRQFEIIRHIFLKTLPNRKRLIAPIVLQRFSRVETINGIWSQWDRIDLHIQLLLRSCSLSRFETLRTHLKKLPFKTMVAHSISKIEKERVSEIKKRVDTHTFWDEPDDYIAAFRLVDRVCRGETRNLLSHLISNWKRVAGSHKRSDVFHVNDAHLQESVWDKLAFYARVTDNLENELYCFNKLKCDDRPMDQTLAARVEQLIDFDEFEWAQRFAQAITEPDLRQAKLTRIASHQTDQVKRS